MAFNATDCRTVGRTEADLRTQIFYSFIFNLCYLPVKRSYLAFFLICYHYCFLIEIDLGTSLKITFQVKMTSGDLKTTFYKKMTSRIILLYNSPILELKFEIRTFLF